MHLLVNMCLANKHVRLFYGISKLSLKLMNCDGCVYVSAILGGGGGG